LVLFVPEDFPEQPVLRISQGLRPDCTVMELEGRLAGPWVEELRCCWQQLGASATHGGLLLDLKSVSFVDDSGQALLREMRDRGVRLVGRGLMIRHLVEQIEKERWPSPV
jgi:anti-anti-sigma regulatory factor